MKKATAFLTMLIVCVTLCSCSNVEDPKYTVTKAFEAIKTLDYSAMSQYFEYADLLTQANLSQTTFKDEDILSILLSNLECKPVSSSVNGDTATVKAEITNIDMKQILPEYYTELARLAFSKNKTAEDNSTKKNAGQFLTDRMKSPDCAKVTNTVDIRLTKKDTAWRINISDEALVNSIMGDLITAAKKSSATDNTQVNTENVPVEEKNIDKAE